SVPGAAESGPAAHSAHLRIIGTGPCQDGSGRATCAAMDAATYVLEDLPYELDDAAARRARLLPVAFVVVAALVLGAAGAWMLADLRADAGDQADELRLLQETLRSTTDELVATKADVQRLMGQLSAARGDAPA